METPVPPSVTALIVSGRLPAQLAECFDPAETLSSHPDWIDVADLVNELLPAADVDIRGALALLGAYAHLEACEAMCDELGDRSARASELPDEAVTSPRSPPRSADPAPAKAQAAHIPDIQSRSRDQERRPTADQTITHVTARIQHPDRRGAELTTRIL